MRKGWCMIINTAIGWMPHIEQWILMRTFHLFLARCQWLARVTPFARWTGPRPGPRGKHYPWPIMDTTLGWTSLPLLLSSLEHCPRFTTSWEPWARYTITSGPRCASPKPSRNKLPMPFRPRRCWTLPSPPSCPPWTTINLPGCSIVERGLVEDFG